MVQLRGRYFFTVAFLLLSGCTRTSMPAPVVISPTRVPAATNSISATPVAQVVPSLVPATISPSPELPPTAVPVQAHIPDSNQYTWKLVVGDLTAPTDIQSPQDGSGRLFVVEQPGQIFIVRDGQLQQPAFLDIRDRVWNDGSEQGLLGLAFHPQFAQNGYFFVNYTDRRGNTHIARFTASADQADPASEKQLLFVQQPFPNHNGGALHFSPQGYLIIGLGDGGSGGDPYGNAQSLNSLLGKLLRLDVDHGDPYVVPADNPFAAGGGFSEIWALGLRNPWRFSYDRLTGDLWVADVGQDAWEEIDFIPAGTAGGLNFGWNLVEAMHPYRGDSQPGFVVPVAEYPHGPECSVSGGYVYRGEQLPDWKGIYIYGDYCTGAIWGLPSPPQGAAPVLLFQTGFMISTFGEDDAGELYVADYHGSLYRLDRLP